MAKSNPRHTIIREWTSLAIASAGERLCGGRHAAPPPASQQASAARCPHDMAAAAHWAGLRTAQRMALGEKETEMRSGALRNLKSAEVIIRFAIRMTVLVGFAAVPGIDFSSNLALLLWMSTILSAIFATVRRELPLGSSLNYWDEAAAFIALCYLVTSINQAAAT